VSALIFLWLGLCVPFVVFLVGASLLVQGVPLLAVVWQVAPASRASICLAGLALALGGTTGALIAHRVWAGVDSQVRGELAWVFATRTLRVTGFATGDPARRERAGLWFRIYEQFGAPLAALLGVAAAAAVILPAALWGITGGAVVRAELAALGTRRDRIALTTLAASLVVTVCTGLPAALVGWLRFARRRLRLGDDEIRRFLPR
jgi:hypothetical protein